MEIKPATEPTMQRILPTRPTQEGKEEPKKEKCYVRPIKRIKRDPLFKVKPSPLRSLYYTERHYYVHACNPGPPRSIGRNHTCRWMACTNPFLFKKKGMLLILCNLPKHGIALGDRASCLVYFERKRSDYSYDNSRPNGQHHAASRAHISCADRA